MTITPYPSNSTTAIRFTITGKAGTTGFINMTLPKSMIPIGTSPTVYIDGQQAQNQGYTQDANNYYVWFTTHFSTHKIEIVFATPSPTITPTPTPTPPPVSLWLYISATIVVIAVVAIVTAVLLTRRRHKNQQG
jgi:hypothetical protein